MSKDNGTEYVFIERGREHYEIVFEAKEVFTFQKMHNATIAMPEREWTKIKTDLEGGEYITGDQPFTCPRCGTRTATREDGREYCPADGLSFKTTTEYEL
jgi:hypothetical protein